jgi:hypothetical protein
MMLKKDLFIFLLMIFIVSFSSCQNNKARPVKVFLLGGQSNMEGCGKMENMPDAYKTHPENAVVWDNKKTTWDDNTHFDATSQIWLGNEMGEIMTNRNLKY